VERNELWIKQGVDRYKTKRAQDKTTWGYDRLGVLSRLL